MFHVRTRSHGVAATIVLHKVLETQHAELVALSCEVARLHAVIDEHRDQFLARKISNKPDPFREPSKRVPETAGMSRRQFVQGFASPASVGTECHRLVPQVAVVPRLAPAQPGNLFQQPQQQQQPQPLQQPQQQQPQQQQQQAPSLFGGVNTSGGFGFGGVASQPSNMFGAAAPPNTSSSLFGTTSAAQFGAKPSATPFRF